PREWGDDPYGSEATSLDRRSCRCCAASSGSLGAQLHADRIRATIAARQCTRTENRAQLLRGIARQFNLHALPPPILDDATLDADIVPFDLLNAFMVAHPGRLLMLTVSNGLRSLI